MTIDHATTSMLKRYSRTFFDPILALPDGLQEAVASAYLAARAIDEVEDHVSLSKESKIYLLNEMAEILSSRSSTVSDSLTNLFEQYTDKIDPITTNLDIWINISPHAVKSLITNTLSSMATEMAYWAKLNWEFKSEEDLDKYTNAVAGTIGSLLCDLWYWHDGIDSNKDLAYSFGRGLQAVNILNNRADDQNRGVDFFPEGWVTNDIHEYALKNLISGNQYVESLPNGSAHHFCEIPLKLAHATLDSIVQGRKLQRTQVERIINQKEKIKS